MQLKNIGAITLCTLLLSACGANNVRTNNHHSVKPAQTPVTQQKQYVAQYQQRSTPQKVVNRVVVTEPARVVDQKYLAAQRQQAAIAQQRLNQQRQQVAIAQQRVNQQRQQAAAAQQRLKQQQAAAIAQQRLNQQRQQAAAIAQQRLNQQRRQQKAVQQLAAQQNSRPAVSPRRQQITAQQHAEQAYRQQQQVAARQRAEQAQRQQQQIAARQRVEQQRRQQQQLAVSQRQMQQVAQRPQVGVPPPVQLQRATHRAYRGPGRLRRVPDTVAASLRLRGVSERGMSTYVRAAHGREPALLAARADVPRNPASTMKLVTTYAALGTLGANYRWPTELYISGPIVGNTLRGNVIIKGYGDPNLKEQDLRRMLQALRSRGIVNITGNLVTDTSYFNIPYQHPGAFDGKAKSAYNAQPDALLYQGRGSHYRFAGLGKRVTRNAGRGPRSSKARADLNKNLFAAFWKIWVGEMRGSLQGRMVKGRATAPAQKIFTHFSQPLRTVLPIINKKSNNVMARQLMLTIASKRMGAPGSPRKGAMAIGQFLESRGLRFPELRIENGSGLSRISRISARNLGEMLVDAYNSPYRNDFMNSLAILGVDGTLRNRMKTSGIAGRGKFKTGTLRNVRGIAGYVQGANGQTYVLSILHNDPQARRKARKAHDELIKWTYWGAKSAGNFAQN